MLVDVHNAAPSDRVGSSPENIYERERLQRMKRNAEMMHQLGLQHMATDLATAPTRDASEAPAPARRRGATKPKRGTRAPTRQSARTRRAQGLDAVDHDHLDDTTERDTAADMLDKAPLDEDLLDLESYFKLIGKDVSGALQSDGCFRGWIAPDVALKMGIALTEDGAPPPGAAACAMSGRPKGWSGARANAYAQRHKNPNAYFYRHVAPDQQQAQGEWSQEEHELFMRTAREHGVGDRWGLFASYVPQRVGYQCSAYYRDVIIPSGLVLDARFKMQRNGKAVFVG